MKTKQIELKSLMYSNIEIKSNFLVVKNVPSEEIQKLPTSIAIEKRPHLPRMKKTAFLLSSLTQFPLK